MPHPADQDDLQAIPQASYFIASIFLGRGEFDKSEQSDLQSARAIASKMETHYRNGRGGMVYAVLPNGRSVLVPTEYQPKENEMTDVTTNEIPGFLKKDKIPAQPKAKKNGASTKRAPAAKIGKKAAKETKVAKAKAVKALKPAKAAKPAKAKAVRVPGGARGAIIEAAKRGEMPTPPDFSANTHKPHRKRLDYVIALAKAGDVKGLKEFKINPTSTSPKAIDRYRNLAVMALEAKKAA